MALQLMGGGGGGGGRGRGSHSMIHRTCMYGHTNLQAESCMYTHMHTCACTCMAHIPMHDYSLVLH